MNLKTSITIIIGCLVIFLFVMLPIFISIEKKEDDYVKKFQGSSFSLNDVNNDTADLPPLGNLDWIPNETLKNAAKNGSLKEIFGAGTAAVVSQINAFQHKGELFELNELENSYAEKLKSNLVGIQTNQLADHHSWRYKI